MIKNVLQIHKAL